MALQRNTSLAGAAPRETAGFGGPPRHKDGRDAFGQALRQGLGTGPWMTGEPASGARRAILRCRCD